MLKNRSRLPAAIVLFALALSCPAKAAQTPEVMGAPAEVLRFPDREFPVASLGTLESCPTCVTLSPHGAPEDLVLDRDGGYRAVRFDPPFEPPYTIREISFPSVTMNGVPARFLSVRLCGVDASGRPLLTAPIFLTAPFEGSANGMNSVPIDLLITEPGRTFYWIIEFPRRGSAHPSDQPFIRVDIADMERGFYGTTYDITERGLAARGGGGNMVVDMTCELGSAALVPIKEPTNLGANWRADRFDFSFRSSGDTTAAFEPMPRNSLRHTTLSYRADFGAWKPFADIGSGADMISVPVDSIPIGAQLWSVQASDRLGNSSAYSSVVIASRPSGQPSPFEYDSFEPNGRIGEGRYVSVPADRIPAAIFPVGDLDFYRFEARPGDTVRAGANAFIGSGSIDHLLLGLALYDGAGKLLAFSDRSAEGLSPRIDYEVPQSGRGLGGPPKRFSLKVFDVRGSEFSPLTNRRSAINGMYDFDINVVAYQASVIRSSRQTGGRPAALMTVYPTRSGDVVFRINGVDLSTNAQGATLRLFDAQGRQIRTLNLSRGGASVTCTWDGTGSSGGRVSRGMYFARLDVGGCSTTRKFLLTK